MLTDGLFAQCLAHNETCDSKQQFDEIWLTNNIVEHNGYLGTGKTLMARQIGKMLNTREPKIISGPGKIYFAMFSIYAVFQYTLEDCLKIFDQPY